MNDATPKTTDAKTRPVQPMVSLGAALAFMNHAGDPPHPWSTSCSVCGENCTTTALTELVYAFELCDCDHSNFTHLIEHIYHRKCFAG